MAFHLATVFGFLLICGLALFVFLLVGKWLRPRDPNERKASTYECAEQPVGPAWFNFNNRFYVIALVFVVFDVEIALVVPAIALFRDFLESGNGLLVFLEVFLFLGVLFVALVYFWICGDLNWIRDIKEPTCQPVEGGRKEAP